MRGSQRCGKLREDCLVTRKGARHGGDFPLLPGGVQSLLSPLPTSAARGSVPGDMGRELHTPGPPFTWAWGRAVLEGVWLPGPANPLLPRLRHQDNRTARQRLRTPAVRCPDTGRVPAGAPWAGGGRGRPRPTSSSSVMVFLQLCIRVVKLDVVGERQSSVVSAMNSETEIWSGLLQRGARHKRGRAVSHRAYSGTPVALLTHCRQGIG